MLSGDGELYKGETCIGKTVFVMVDALRRSRRSRQSGDPVVCVVILSFAAGVTRKLKYAGLDSLLV